VIVLVYIIGYLNSISKGKPIPSECMGCPDILIEVADIEENAYIMLKDFE